MNVFRAVWNWISPTGRKERKKRDFYQSIVGNPEPILLLFKPRSSVIQWMRDFGDWAREEQIRTHLMLRFAGHRQFLGVEVAVGNETDAVKVKLRWS